MQMIKGIDISHWQKKVDFDVLQDVDKVDFCILKAGGSDKGCYVDSAFYSRYEECKKRGINVGAYYFVGSKCDSDVDGAADAVRFLDIIRGLKFEYPIYIDFEAPPATNREGNTDACIAFCRVCEQEGYYVGIYASDISGFKDKLDINRLTPYDKWVARYGSTPKYVKNYGIWQASSDGIINGIKSRVDCNVSYNYYPEIIKHNHLNGY